jgi:hypothetical protein
LKDIWRKASIDQVKRACKLELDAVQQEQGATKKLEYILASIEHLAKSDEDDAMLKRFVLIISALLHHLNFGGLRNKQINELSDLAEAILKVAGIKPIKSQVSFLYGELHYVLGEIHLSNGEFMQGIWEHQLGSHLSTMTEQLNYTRQLAMGIYALRLGNSQLGQHFLNRAEQQEESLIIRDKARVHLVRSRRLSGDINGSIELCKQYISQACDHSFRIEFEWEQICAGISKGDNPSSLISLCKRGRPHYQTSYLLECFLWLRSLPQTTYFGRIPKLTSLAQYKEIRFRDYPVLHGICQQIENAYDTSIPFSTRLTTMKKILAKIPSIRNIDKELLVWVSLSRWLYRNRYMDIAAITFQEYISLSQRLSSGRSQDVLGIAKDLCDIDWTTKI